jgi:hypothetical protein
MITEMENSGSRKEKKNRDCHIQHIVLARILETFREIYYFGAELIHR